MKYFLEFEDKKKLETSKTILDQIPLLREMLASEEINEESITIPLPNIQLETFRIILSCLEQKTQTTDQSSKWYNFSPKQYNEILEATHFLLCSDIEKDLTTHSIDDKEHSVQEFIQRIKTCEAAYLRSNITFYFRHQGTRLLEEVAIDQAFTRLYSKQKIDFFGAQEDWIWLESIFTSFTFERIALDSTSFGATAISELFRSTLSKNPKAFDNLETLILKGCCSGHFGRDIEAIVQSIGHNVALSLQDIVEECYMFQLCAIAKINILTSFQYLTLGSNEPLDIDCANIF